MRGFPWLINNLINERQKKYKSYINNTDVIFIFIPINFLF